MIIIWRNYKKIIHSIIFKNENTFQKLSRDPPFLGGPPPARFIWHQICIIFTAPLYYIHTLLCLNFVGFVPKDCNFCKIYKNDLYSEPESPTTKSVWMCESRFFLLFCFHFVRMILMLVASDYNEKLKIVFFLLCLSNLI